jgi:hypothetical protein
MNETLQLRDELREALLEAQDTTRWLRAELRTLTQPKPEPKPTTFPIAGLLVAAVSMVGLAWWAV